MSSVYNPSLTRLVWSNTRASPSATSSRGYYPNIDRDGKEKDKVKVKYFYDE